MLPVISYFRVPPSDFRPCLAKEASLIGLPVMNLPFSSVVGGRWKLNVIAESIVNAFKEPFTVEGVDVFVGASVGIAIAPDDGNDGEQLMKAADIALYAAKNDGRGRARSFNRSMLIMLEQREMLRRGLRVALQERQFFLEYQPLIETDAIVGFQALLRWQHPYAGIVPPAVFIPLAEADGLMGEIGEWVLEQACRQAVNWPEHFTVAVNLSPAEFLRKGLTDRVANTLILRVCPQNAWSWKSPSRYCSSAPPTTSTPPHVGGDGYPHLAR